MRISDWSSDVCSSDLLVVPVERTEHGDIEHAANLERQPVAAPDSAPAVFRHQPLHRHVEIVSRGEGLLEKILAQNARSEEHTSELQSLMRISYAVFCLKKKNKHHKLHRTSNSHVKLTTNEQHTH